ncbi:helix-turn-helix domain-containing protein [Acinetobacter puyangensis]|uniref:helix-turn-helix domain-containing protein n=1 Tax=Acinetobacter puyangensis TaxID=1096779 RepID=UPI003A4DE0AE
MTNTLSSNAPGIYQHELKIPAEWSKLSEIHHIEDGITIGCMNGQTENDLTLNVTASASICISIMLEGRFDAKFDGGSYLNVRSGMAVAMSGTQNTNLGGTITFYAGNPFRLVDIRLRPDILHQLIGQQQLDLKGRMVNDSSLIQNNAFMGGWPASNILLKIANDILSCRLTDPNAKRLYLRAKALEVLSNVIEEIISKQYIDLPVPADRQRLLLAQTIIQQSHGKDCYIQALCRKVGLNEKKLQAGFKAFFGQSVHHYITQIRMEAAMKMLVDGMPIIEVADAVGYSSLSHFSKTFRIQIGMSPSQWTKRN